MKPHTAPNLPEWEAKGLLRHIPPESAPYRAPCLWR